MAVRFGQYARRCWHVEEICNHGGGVQPAVERFDCIGSVGISISRPVIDWTMIIALADEIKGGCIWIGVDGGESMQR